MSKVIWEYFSLYITNSEYVNTFQFLTLNYRLYSANYWYDNCEANKHFFGFLKAHEFFPKLIDFNHPNSGLWNDNLLLMLQDNRALAETIYADQQALVNIYDENGNILQTTTFVDAMENTLLPIVNYKTLNKPAPYKIPEKENKSSHDLNLIQIDFIHTTKLNFQVSVHPVSKPWNNNTPVNLIREKFHGKERRCSPPGMKLSALLE